jgi:hypothetical protein
MGDSRVTDEMWEPIPDGWAKPAWDDRKERPQQPSATQVGGSHYASMAIQPFEYIHANGIGFAEGCVIKYVSRWKAKGGIEDLKKAKHFLDLLIEAESKNG